MMGGSHSVCSIAITMPTVPTIDPTERSMLRETMTSTIPVAMIATDGGLHREVPQVAGSEERSAGEEVKADPDREEDDDHPHHAGVDLVVPEEGAN